MPYKDPTPKQREAVRKMQREWRRNKYKTDPAFRKRVLEANVARSKGLREEVTQYKLEHGCSKCGYTKSARALQFHHADGDKLFNIGESLRLGRKKLWAEIDKCVLLCANCHAEAHDEA